MNTHQFEILLILLAVACIIALITRSLKQPYTIGLVIVGLVIAIVRAFPEIRITHDMVFTFILPPLLFQGALHMNLEDLKKNWKSILMLAIPGVVASTLLIGYALHMLLGLDLFVCLLFGALITPTDPISVLSILKQVGAPKRLRVMLEGESLFNDGTGVVVFVVLLSIVTGKHNFELGYTASKFLMVTGGGTLIGLGVGWLANQILKRIDDHLIEVAITIILVFGTPLLAEHFHMSGIIALVIVGLILGNYGRAQAMSEKTKETLESFWEVIDFVINSFLFLLIGIELQAIGTGDFEMFAKPIVIGIITMLVARMIVVYPIVGIKNKINPDDKIDWRWAHVLFWGGLKGSIPIALVVGMYGEFEHRALFLTVAFSCVLFSLIVQGLTIKPLIKALKIS